MISTTTPPASVATTPGRLRARRRAWTGPAAKGVVLVGAWFGGGAAARAQAPSASDVAAARALGQEGVRLADEGRCDEAVERLERAEQLFHAPSLLGRLGECQVALGKLALGAENLQKVAREPLPPGASSAFVAAKARAQRVLEQALPRLARLRVVVVGPAEARASVAVDGEPVPPEQLGRERAADPGERTIDASAPGFRKVSRRVNLASGETTSVTLALEPEPAPAARLDARAGAGRAVVPPGAGGGAERGPRGSGAPSAWSYAAFGVGVAGLATGAVLGAVTLARKSELEEACPAGACRSPEQQGDIDAMKRTGDWSTAAFAVGGAGAGLGALLWWLAPARPDARGAGGASGVAVGAWAAGPVAGLRGHFP